MSDVTALFARGEFSSLVGAFQNAGFLVQQPLHGVLQIGHARPSATRKRVLISVGVHGDETAPIEIMAQLMRELGKHPRDLAVDLMLVIGNIEAIAQAKRFIDVDLNRLFTPGRTQFNQTSEAQRADQLMAASETFFAGHTDCWHLDLHTAIRASFYPTFAIVPGSGDAGFIAWLGQAGIEAAVLNPDASVTYSSFTCMHLGALSCTAELGRIGVMGKNDLSQFVQTGNAIAALLTTGQITTSSAKAPLVFRVCQELIKRSDAFQLAFDSGTENFTRFEPDALIATDGEVSYRVGEKPEYVLFPNQNVRVGLRAGLMVVRVS